MIFWCGMIMDLKQRITLIKRFKAKESERGW